MMAKVFASCPKVFALATVVLLLSSCGNGSNSKPASQAFSKTIYSTMDRRKEIRIISGTEIELSDGNLVGSYTREGNKIRAVFEAHSRYFIETEEGLTAEEGHETYYSEAAHKRIDKEIEAERQARIKQMEEYRLVEGAERQARIKKTEEDRQAAIKKMEENRQMAEKLPTEMTIDLEHGVKLDLLRILPGIFEMGSPVGEAERQEREGPQHQVTISQAFYMGKYAVTQEQYEAVTGNNPSHFKGPKKPVETVSWDEAQEFCKKLSLKYGKTITLPTEAQWEYACRAGTATPFYFGNTISTDEVNYDGNYSYGNGVKGEYREKTTDVGSFKPNKFGLYDMHGNVWQWCQDYFDEKDYANSSGVDPQGPAQCANRVVRGGCWLDFARSCRSSNRNGASPDNRSFNVGFRVVVAPSSRTPP